ncbi:MAG TPA: T9SS type A sorting domain-containing protein, partial [Candidatus Eisenbacteria bacterium]|nr:T9SS type A sorting domain-containing protein [Candidatus Eisenbacteria bacterium]
FTPTDVDPSTLRLFSAGTGSVSQIAASAPKSGVIGDTDKNDIPEYPACFATSDAAALFSLLRGKQDVPVRLEGSLTDGRRFCSSFTLPIIGKGTGAVAARVEPNPLNPEGTLRFTAKSPGAVTIRLFDVNGRLVRSLWNARATAPGPQEVRIDGKDGSGRTLRSGVYFYRIDGADLNETGRFTILK